MDVKYRVLGLLFVMQLVNYLDRVNLSVAAPTMMRELHLSPGKFGFILAAFTLGYAIAQIPGGALGDRFGPNGCWSARRSAGRSSPALPGW